MVIWYENRLFFIYLKAFDFFPLNFFVAVEQNDNTDICQIFRRCVKNKLVYDNVERPL